MYKVTVTKELNFCAAHRLLGHGGACKNIHGHNYKAFVTLAREGATVRHGLEGRLGMVIDFKIIKDKLQVWLDKNLDHALIVNSNDKLLLNFAKGSFKYFLMECNATAENLALLIYDKAQDMFMNDTFDGCPDEFKIVKVKVYETDTCYAEVRGG